jgi:hypothetical protein
MPALTRQGPHALPSAPYGDFSGKPLASAGAHPVDALTQLGPHAVARARYGDFSGRTATVALPAEALHGGFRLTPEQVARLRGHGAKPFREPELDAATASSPDVNSAASSPDVNSAMSSPDVNSEALAAELERLALTDLVWRRTEAALLTEAQARHAREEEEALVLMLALMEDL